VVSDVPGYISTQRARFLRGGTAMTAGAKMALQGFFWAAVVEATRFLVLMGESWEPGALFRGGESGGGAEILKPAECGAPTALRICFCYVFPALTDWANLCRTSGALEKGAHLPSLLRAGGRRPLH